MHSFWVYFCIFFSVWWQSRCCVVLDKRWVCWNITCFTHIFLYYSPISGSRTQQCGSVLRPGAKSGLEISNFDITYSNFRHTNSKFWLTRDFDLLTWNIDVSTRHLDLIVLHVTLIRFGTTGHYVRRFNVSCGFLQFHSTQYLQYYFTATGLNTQLLEKQLVQRTEKHYVNIYLDTTRNACFNQSKTGQMKARVYFMVGIIWYT